MGTNIKNSEFKATKIEVECYNCGNWGQGGQRFFFFHIFGCPVNFDHKFEIEFDVDNDIQQKDFSHIPKINDNMMIVLRGCGGESNLSLNHNDLDSVSLGDYNCGDDEIFVLHNKGNGYAIECYNKG